MARVKITVMKRTLMPELIEKYSADPDLQLCETFREGQVFYTDRVSRMPEGFCGFAWADIHKDIVALVTGGSFGWIKGKGKQIPCCTDGLRPVFFLLERVDEDGNVIE